MTQPPPPPGPRWTTDGTPGAGAGQAPPPPPPPPAPAGGNGGGKWVVVGVVAILVGVLVLAGIGALAFLASGDDAPVTSTTAITTPTPDRSTAPATPSEPPEPSQSATPGNPLDGLGGLDGLEGLTPDADMMACLAGDAQPSLSGAELPDDPAAKIRAIADQVAALRGFDDVTTDVELELLSSDELAVRITEITLEDYPPAEAALDDAILTTLGQLDRSLDLREVYVDLLGEQVAGFYDPDTGELVAQSDADPGPDQLMIIAHELDHALGDEALGLPELDVDGADDGDVDGLLARQALVEGDATVLMQHWALANLGLGDLLSLGTAPIETSQLEAAPAVLQAQLLYPYDEGLAFVCSLYNEGGWGAVNEAYEQAPTTSAQVLFPERYAAGQDAVEVDDLAATGGWELQRDTTWGAAELLWLLQAPGDDPAQGPADARERAGDWAGGRQFTWQQGDDTMVAMQVAQQPGGDLCTSLDDWAQSAWPDGEAQATGDTTTVTTPDTTARVTCSDDEVTVVVGPDATAVDAVG